METIRLDKILTDTGEMTRSEAKNAILRGRVTVAGQLQRRPEYKVSREELICLDGEPVFTDEHVYYLLHKPADYVSSTEDEKYPSVMRLLPPSALKRGAAPVGRLDADVTGLLIITDDGEYLHRVIHPRSGVVKKYIAVTDIPVTPFEIASFAEGTTLSDGTAYKPAELEIVSPDGLTSAVKITEGKFHEVKNLYAARGIKVLQLCRVSVGGIILPENLPMGDYRQISPAEARKAFI